MLMLNRLGGSRCVDCVGRFGETCKITDTKRGRQVRARPDQNYILNMEAVLSSETLE